MMKLRQIQEAICELKNEIGPACYISISMDPTGFGGKFLHAALWPFGICIDEGYLFFGADSFEGALSQLREGWNEYRQQHHQQLLCKMATAIIRLTYELGECTDAALRLEFDNAQIASIGEEACELANTMGAKGPFSIRRQVGANAA